MLADHGEAARRLHHVDDAGHRLGRPASKDVDVAPNFGGWIMTAVSMPGSFTSRVKGCVPLDFAGLS